MKNYFPSIEKDSLKNLLSRLCAKDGLPFSILASSEDIRKGMAKLGFDLPKSTETIRKHILEFADDIQLLYSSLQIIEGCIEVICKKNCTLVEAFCSIEITLSSISQSKQCECFNQ
ncbi:hypothetical protein BLOT_005864 [Blomia tropicalis]|nr:hypothetical protein BLOT_005864 [Blomia tropicalis]